MAQPIAFSTPITIAVSEKQEVFHHLESSGRKNIAVSGSTIAVIWEDNHRTDNAVYIVFKKINMESFSQPMKLSGDGPAFEPVITGAGDNRFIAGWEENDTLIMRTLSPAFMGKPVIVDSAPARQLSLHRSGARIVAAWARQESKFSRIMAGNINIRDKSLKLSHIRKVDTAPITQSQLYPSIAVINNNTVVAWEDRRHGHTRIYYAKAIANQAFQTIQQLNEHLPSPNPALGKGSGATRVALAARNKILAATWMDKRDFFGGYDTYAAFYDTATQKFGRFEIAQDEFGNNTPQWHPAIAVAPNDTTVIAWDDTRDESPDIWLSVKRLNDYWSEDFTLPHGSGPGAQTHPSIAIDEENILHIVWVSRDVNNRSGILYAKGQLQD